VTGQGRLIRLERVL